MNAKDRIARIKCFWKPFTETFGLLLTSASVLAFGFWVAPYIAQELAPIDTRMLPYLLIFPPFFLAMYIPLSATINVMEYLDRRVKRLKKRR